MIHDADLLDALSKLEAVPLDCIVFRATAIRVDPLAPSVTGGRWAPHPSENPNFSVLYTSFARDGALAEISAFFAGLTPLPVSRPVKVSRLSVSVSKALRISESDLLSLGVDAARYGERDYQRTQKIGAAAHFLGFDGLIAPSARWKCDNLVIFTNNHSLDEKLEVVDDTQVHWYDWAVKNSVIR